MFAFAGKNGGFYEMFFVKREQFSVLYFDFGNGMLRILELEFQIPFLFSLASSLYCSCSNTTS